METLSITFCVETEDGEETQMILTQKDLTSLWMTVGGKRYKIYLNGLLLNMFTFEMRRREMQDREEKDHG